MVLVSYLPGTECEGTLERYFSHCGLAIPLSTMLEHTKTGSWKLHPSWRMSTLGVVAAIQLFSIL